jgi:hypothetical protein
MKESIYSALRWDHYIARQGSDFHRFWEEILGEKERKLLFILGLGFDPRMCAGLKAILNSGGAGICECLLIEYNEGTGSPSKKYIHLVDKNRELLKSLISKKGKLRSTSVKMWSDDGRMIGSRRASEIIDASAVDEYTDIILDISALPRGIYFPLIAKLLYILDSMQKSSQTTNLHVIIAEDVDLDKKIQEEGIDENASYLHGFSSDLEQESTEGIPVIWIPILGEKKEAQLIRIYDHIKPDEICPVLPSPSRNPRRSDNLILEYRELLFDRLRVEPQNIIYASEGNPFEVYRQIYLAIERYDDALEALGGCKVVISAVSSKLLGIGALLASYDAKRAGYRIGISHVESHGYIMLDSKSNNNSEELFTLWLAGECYNE